MLEDFINYHAGFEEREQNFILLQAKMSKSHKNDAKLMI